MKTLIILACVLGCSLLAFAQFHYEPPVHFEPPIHFDPPVRIDPPVHFDPPLSYPNPIHDYPQNPGNENSSDNNTQPTTQTRQSLRQDAEYYAQNLINSLPILDKFSR